MFNLVSFNNSLLHFRESCANMTGHDSVNQLKEIMMFNQIKKYFWLLALIVQPVYAASTFSLEYSNGQNNTTINVGEQVEVYIRITNNDNARVVTTTINFDPTALEIIMLDPDPNDPTKGNYPIGMNGTSITNQNIDNLANGQLTFKISLFPDGFPNGESLIAKLAFTAKQEANNIQIKPSNSTMLIRDSGGNLVTVDPNPAPTGVSLNIIAPPPATFNPAPGATLTINDNGTATVTVTASANISLTNNLSGSGFSLDPNSTCGATLNANQSCVYVIAFNNNADSAGNFSISINGTVAANYNLIGRAVVAPPASATPVPTMSAWGLMIMSALLGLLAVRRRA